MEHRKLIGISGKARSGKDTAGKYLIDNHGFKKISFAEPLKKHLYILNPYICSNDGHSFFRYQSIVDMLGEDTAKEQFKEIRRLQQIYGTEVIRDAFGKDAWVDLAFKRIKESNCDVVVTDVRFPNELKRVKEYGGRLIKIKSNRTLSTDMHASEQDLPDTEFDFIVENNASLAEYFQEIDKIYGNISSSSG